MSHAHVTYIISFMKFSLESTWKMPMTDGIVRMVMGWRGLVNF